MQYYVHTCVYVSISPRTPMLYAPQRQGKVQDIYLKCSKARNDYLLNLAAANASMNKYYLQDISTLIDVSASAHIHACSLSLSLNQTEHCVCLKVMIPHLWGHSDHMKNFKALSSRDITLKVATLYCPDFSHDLPFTLSSILLSDSGPGPFITALCVLFCSDLLSHAKHL